MSPVRTMISAKASTSYFNHRSFQFFNDNWYSYVINQTLCILFVLFEENVIEDDEQALELVDWSICRCLKRFVSTFLCKYLRLYMHRLLCSEMQYF